jgi:hypothetical protein
VRRDVRLEHGFFSGQAKIFVDEKLVFERPVTLSDCGFQHQLSVDGVPCVVKVINNGLTFSYAFIENEVLPEPESKTSAQPKHETTRRVIVLAALFFFALLWCAVGLNLLPLARPLLRARVFYLVLGLIHIPLMIWYAAFSKPKTDSQNDAI